MATKRSPAPGEATSSSHTNRDCSRHRASPRTISGWPNRAAKPTGHWRNTSVRCWPRNPVPANVSAIRVSRQSRRSPISTSPPTPLWTALRSPAWKPADGWPRPAILCCSARLAPGKTHLATALAIAAAHAGHRVAFAPATGWITLLAEAHRIDPNYARSPATGSSSSTKSATSHSTPKRRTCPSNSSPPDTRNHRSS